MSYLERLKAARASTKETKEENFTSSLVEAALTKKVEVTKEASAWQPTYAHPWPDELPGLGPRHVGPFDPCSGCGRGTWARYGGVVLCCPCAIAKLSGESESTG